MKEIRLEQFRIVESAVTSYEQLKEQIKADESKYKHRETTKLFNHTRYRVPPDEDLLELKDKDLTVDQLVDGIGYIIIGRGMYSSKNTDTMLEIAKRLSVLIPEKKDLFIEVAKTIIKEWNEYVNRRKAVEVI